MNNMIDNFFIAGASLWKFLIFFAFFYHCRSVFQRLTSCAVYLIYFKWYPIHCCITMKFTNLSFPAPCHTTALIHTIFSMCIIFKISVRKGSSMHSTQWNSERNDSPEKNEYIDSKLCVCFFCFSHFVWFRREKLIRCPFLHVSGVFNFFFFLFYGWAQFWRFQLMGFLFLHLFVIHLDTFWQMAIER